MEKHPESLPRRRLGSQGLQVSCIGLGCMGMTRLFGYDTHPAPEEECVATLRKAIELGSTFLDTSDVYGAGANEELIGRAIKGLPRESLQIATKFGLVQKDGGTAMDGSPKHCREACEASLQRLGVDYIDLYYLHRKDPATPITKTIAAMKELVEEGKVKFIGVSEASAADIRAAHAVHPLTAVQLEWSLFTRDAETEVIPTCRELGIGIVAYSPLGRGFLTGRIASLEDLSPEDRRRQMPRFQEEAIRQNMKLVDKAKEFAMVKMCSPAQLALAWLLAQGEDVVPIPGCRREKHLRENLGAAHVHLSHHEMAVLEEAMPASKVAGERYPKESMATATFHYGKPKPA